MHRIVVDERKWIGEERFLHALNYCMLLPGPEAQQLATYVGWLMHRTPGGLMAGTLFVLPGVVLNLAAWFSLHTLFGKVDARHAWGLRLLVPDFGSVNLAACGIAAVAFLMTFYWRKGMPITLGSAAVLGVTWKLLAR